MSLIDAVRVIDERINKLRARLQAIADDPDTDSEVACYARNALADDDKYDLETIAALRR